MTSASSAPVVTNFTILVLLPDDVGIFVATRAFDLHPCFLIRTTCNNVLSAGAVQVSVRFFLSPAPPSALDLVPFLTFGEVRAWTQIWCFLRVLSVLLCLRFGVSTYTFCLTKTRRDSSASSPRSRVFCLRSYFDHYTRRTSSRLLILVFSIW